VAVAFMLIIGSGLLVSSFRRVLAIDPGFDMTHVLTANVSLPASRYVVPDDDPTVQDRSRLRRFGEGAERLRAMPGVVNAGMTSAIPLTGGTSTNAVMAEGRPPQARRPTHDGHAHPGDARVPRDAPRAAREGRAPSMRATPKGRRVVIVDTRLAERLWPGQDPIGRRMCQGTPDRMDPRGWQTVVGVVGEVKHVGLVTTGPWAASTTTRSPSTRCWA
jgi:putative ABC transport system permease protein